MVIEVNKKSLVVQSNTLVEAKYRLSVEEQKIIKILIAQIQREDEDFKDVMDELSGEVTTPDDFEKNLSSFIIVIAYNLLLTDGVG